MSLPISLVTRSEPDGSGTGRKHRDRALCPPGAEEIDDFAKPSGRLETEWSVYMFSQICFLK
jgi:hypothetical protein